MVDSAQKDVDAEEEDRNDMSVCELLESKARGRHQS